VVRKEFKSDEREEWRQSRFVHDNDNPTADKQIAFFKFLLMLKQFMLA